MKAEKDEKNELQNILAVTELEFPLDKKTWTAIYPEAYI